jgi:APA family basic amino acid/polyamine antiporter
VTGPDSGSAPVVELRRALGLGSAVLLTVGSVIGSGIFMKPLAVAQALPGPEWVLAVWGLIGLVCFAGGLAYAELGAMFPGAGGQYTFLRRSYGPGTAYLYGWCLFAAINPGTIAALAVAFGGHVGRAAGVPGLDLPMALAMVLVLAVTNHAGVGAGAILQNLATLAKLGILLAIVAGAFAAGSSPGRETSFVPPPDPPSLARGLALAGIAIFWAYEGWHQIGFSAAELRRPPRDLPLGLLLGLALLILLYAGVNAAYFQVLPHAEMRGLSEAVAVPATVFARIFGDGQGRLLLAALALSVLGAANPNLLSTPRAFHAMARDGELPRLLGRLSPRFRTPVPAIWTQAVLAIVLVLAFRDFDDITDYVMTITLAFYGATALGLLRLRRRAPGLARPFRCPCAPLAVLVFLAAIGFVLAMTLAEPDGRRNAAIGLGILGAGWALRLARRAARVAGP